ncbi:MAG: GPMC system MBL fold metallohydrolase [Desulfuromonadales bacterium]|nr:GPMC system MBL fold metallohydrolase [Desulfuromonadales bacterium]
MTNGLKLTILGAGTSTGVPVLGCDCAVCRSKEPLNQRTRCSVLLEWSDRKILVDTATDLRQQALREDIERIDSVLFTHAHADHLHGIDDLRAFNMTCGGSIPIYARSDVAERIRTLFRYIFSDEATPGYRPRLELNVIDSTFELFGQMVIPIPLLHGPGASTGYRVGKLAYLTDCNAIPQRSVELLQGLDLLVIDALRFRAHDSHFSVSEAVQMAQQLGAKRTLLTHLSHDVDYPRHAPGLPEGIEFAYDGQVVVVPHST